MIIAVTGASAITALGVDASETFDRIVRGERGLSELTLFDPGDIRAKLVAEIKGLEVPAGDAISRTSELAMIAARGAMREASLTAKVGRIGLVLGGTTAGMFETESLLATLLSPTPGADERTSALSKMLSHPLSAPTDRLVRELGLPFTRVRTISSACSSGANALLIGATWLRLGLVDAVLCGAADALCRVTVSGFNALAASDPAGARPFDVARRGLTLGEGAGLVVLEGAAAAKARGARAICTLLGWSSRSEAHHITNPEASGRAPRDAMERALARAGLAARDVDYVNAHGTGTPLNDPMEAKALARVLGAELARVPVSSQKGMIGHTLAAAGAIEAVLTALAIDRGVIPPTGGLENVDPECAELNHVRAAVHGVKIRAAISSSFGFGGMDTALVFGAADQISADAPSPISPLKRGVVVTGVSVVTPRGIFSGEDAADALTGAAEAKSVTLPDDALDPDRARRLDRASRLAAVACGRALGVERDAHEREVGVVLGIAFGAVDGTAEFMRRLRDKGPRLVKPADFPSLVPSSPAGHVSIYHGLVGPALLVADLAASGECAVLQACELIAAGEAERIVAGAVEERSAIVEEVLSVLFGGEEGKGDQRREGAAAIALAADTDDVRVLARIGEMVVWRTNGLSGGAPSISPAPSDGRGVVVLGHAGADLGDVAKSWSMCPRVMARGDVTGTHEAAGAIGIAVAAAKVARGDASGALFVGSARGWSYAGTVWPPSRDGRA